MKNPNTCKLLNFHFPNVKHLHLGIDFRSMTESSKAAFPKDLANWENKNGIKSEEINAMKQKITDLRNKLKPKPVKKAKAKKAAPKKVKKTTAKKSKAKPKAKAKAKAKN